MLENTRVGLVGLGAMGAAMAERLVALRCVPAAYDLNPRAAAAAGGCGARPFASAREVAAASDVVCVVVSGDPEARAAVRGPDGVLAGVREGALILLHSTNLPQTTIELADAARAKGAALIDACMVGGPPLARQGKIVFLVGGDAADVERARPVLLALGEQVVHVGETGRGNIAKLQHNLIKGAELLVLEEALRVGMAAGLPADEALSVLFEVYSGNALTHWGGCFAETQDGSPRISTIGNILRKDIPLAGELARKAGLEAPMLETLLRAAQKTVREVKASS